MQQVAEQVKNHLATLLSTGQISDPRLRGVSLTRVTMTPDLQTARVSYSVMGGEKEKKEAQKGFSSASGFLRRSVGQVLQLRYAPQLVFQFDASVEHAARMSEVLRRARESDAQNQNNRETETPESTAEAGDN